MSNATRYLCAAAYLDEHYAAVVNKHLTSSHRAVAPSIGIDLGPIMRHCLRARGMRMIRDLALAILLFFGLILITERTIEILIISFLVGFLPSVHWTRKSLGVKVIAVIGSVLLLTSVAGALAIAGAVRGLESVTGGLSGTSDQGLTGTTQGGGLSAADLLTLLLVAGIVVTQVAYTYIANRTLCDELGPDGRPQPHRRRSPVVESRIAEIEGSQYGNVVLYSGENPFVGAGWRGQNWSIAIELQRANDSRQPPWGPQRAESYVPIDPVELHNVIRARLLRLKDEELPPNERLSALTVEDHIVGTGVHRYNSPLIDPERVVPYSLASPEAVEALIRHPQAGVRYYQRVSVCDEGAAVWSGQRKVIDGSDQDISASAMIYIAVEGRMFYLEFVPTVMHPVYPGYRQADTWPELTSGKFFVKVLLESFSSIFRSLFYAPARVCRTAAMLVREGRTYKEDAAAAKEYLFGDIGAEVSVREIGSANMLLSFIQELDAEKYTKLIERLVNDTVLDFLAAKGVDTSAYAESAGVVINNSGMMVGNNATFNGSVAGGARNRTQQPRAAQRTRA